MTIGNRILLAKRKASQDLIEAFKALPVANVSDCMTRVFAAGPTLRPMHRSGTLAGPALTVRSRPGDNLFLHKAIDMANPGDVIVMDAGGDLTNSLMGELMLAHAMKRGVAGFVLNGAIRDVDEIYKENLPVYAAGVIIIALMLIGVYSIHGRMFDVYLMLGFGLIGFAMDKLDYPLPPVVLGVILGSFAEQNLRLALRIGRGDWSILWVNTASVILILLTVAVVVGPLVMRSFRKWRGPKNVQGE